MTETITHKQYALKCLAKEIISDAAHREKVKTEISIHRKLKHENIVEFIDQFADHWNIYIQLEHCSKYTLKQYQKSCDIITESQCRYFVYQILKGVKYLHENLIIHRDLKLSNILLTIDYQVKICDFGLAIQMDKTNCFLKNVCGTRSYFSPELVNEKPYSFDVDVWCIGVILFTLIVGELPFESDDSRIALSNISSCAYK